MDAFHLILRKLISEIGWQQHQPSPQSFYVVSIEPLKVEPKQRNTEMQYLQFFLQGHVCIQFLKLLKPLLPLF